MDNVVPRVVEVLITDISAFFPTSEGLGSFPFSNSFTHAKLYGMKIYTRTGDHGTSSLFGNQRVSKTDLRLNAFGTIDELNSVLGIARAKGLPARCDEIVLRLQNQLFDLGAEIASVDAARQGTESLTAAEVADQEARIDELDRDLPPLTAFVLPGGTEAAATLHLARCVCRRAEREIVALSQQVEVREVVLQFMNRTSDLLFVMARATNAAAGGEDQLWSKVR